MGLLLCFLDGEMEEWESIGLERYEGEQIMTELSFLGVLSL